VVVLILDNIESTVMIGSVKGVNKEPVHFDATGDIQLRVALIYPQCLLTTDADSMTTWHIILLLNY